MAVYSKKREYLFVVRFSNSDIIQSYDISATAEEIVFSYKFSTIHFLQFSPSTQLNLYRKGNGRNTPTRAFLLSH